MEYLHLIAIIKCIEQIDTREAHFNEQHHILMMYLCEHLGVG